MSLSFKYCNFIVKFPKFIFFTFVIFSLAFCLYSVFFIKLPDFSDPQLGFETRGTTLSDRVVTLKLLADALDSSNILSNFPLVKSRSARESTKKRLRNKLVNWKNQISKPKRKEPFFCGVPGDQYSSIIFQSNNQNDIFTLPNLEKLCLIEEFIMQMKEANSICETKLRTGLCCKAWSLANFVALQNKKSSCRNLTNPFPYDTLQLQDVENSKKILEDCRNYSSQLKASCYEESDRCGLPLKCVEENAVFYILFYMVNSDFIRYNKSLCYGSETAIYFPFAKSSATLDLFKKLQMYLIGPKHWSVIVVGVDFGLKYVLFENILIEESRYLIGGVIFVGICIWIYTESLFITLVTFYSIVSALVISYFIYFKVFQLSFFPFMNMLAIIVSLGIGADDAFIFCKFWNDTKNIRKSRLQTAFSHAITSIFLTTVTTAISFYSTAFNAIIAIRCFSIFSGTIVVVHFFILIVWFPACLVLSEKLASFKCMKINLILSKVFNKCQHWTVQFVVRFRILWIVLLLLCAGISGYIVWYNPALKLPNSKEFQLFKSSHVFEQYDFVYKSKFLSNELDPNAEFLLMPILIIWGVLPIDSGDQMDPYSHGVLTYDPSFDLSTEASQIWLLKFCKNLKQQKFLRILPGPQLLNCFIENFVRWMEIRRCHDPIKKINVSPCCNTTIFPFPQNVFELCLVIYMKEISETPKKYISSYLGGPKFIQNQSRALVVEFLSNTSFTYNYYEIDSFYQPFEHWFKNQLKNAPKEMSSGFFISYLGFYDLQQSLASDTLSSVFFSIIFASIILLLMTGNILINILCTITILATMQTLLGFLVLINWRLNILESLALSSSVGLTVDFSMHYSISYILNEKQQNSNRFISGKRSLLQMIGPTTMACITTAAPGIFMLPSQIQAYIQISTFLIITIILSWIYSTFLFGSILLCFGPEHNCGKINFIFGKRNTQNRIVEQDQVEVTLLKSQQQMISRRHSYPSPHSKLNDNHLEYKRPKSYYY